MTKLPTAIHLKGIRDVNASSSPKVWLNHKLLKLEKSLKVKTHTLAGFNWGNNEPGARQLALAICLEFYSPEIALEVYYPFKSEFLTPIVDDSFSLDFDLAAFNEAHIRQRMKVFT
jgi:hypothetical protein